MEIKTAPKEVSYNFKKEKIKDSDGKVIGESQKLPVLKGTIPVPTADGLLDIIGAGGKELDLLLDVIAETVTDRGRQLINAFREANADKPIPASVLDPVQLAWNVLANLPKSERRGLGISEEDFDSFFDDYRAVMPMATGKTMERIEKHVNIYKKKFSTVRNDKQALKILDDMLALYATATPNLEDQSNVYEYLKKRTETLLQEEEKVLAEAL